MLRRVFLAFTLVALTLAGSTAAGLASTLRGGGGAFGAAPENLVPASADMYMGIDQGNGQAQALAQLWATYRAHPGTGAALDRLLGSNGRQAISVLNTVLGSLGDRAGVALWAPSGPGAAATPPVVVVGQLKATALLSGLGVFSSVLKTTSTTNYRGVTIYRADLGGGGSGYASLVSGDGVLASDLPTIERVIDTATYHAPALANDSNFQSTVAGMRAARALTMYMTPHFFRSALRAAKATAGSLPPQAMLGTQVLSKPLAVAVSAAADGISIVSSVLPATTLGAGVTPNAGASIVGNNAILYESLDNLAAILMAPGLLPTNALNRIQVQTGIAIERDLLPLISHEVIVDINDEPSAILAAVTLARNAGSQVIPTLPGSLELGMWVDSPTAATQALLRIVNDAVRGLLRGQAGISLTLVKTTLADGSAAYEVPGVSGMGFTVRGHWLLISTNLNAEIISAHVPLGTDPGYQSGLAHVGGAGPLYNVSYLNVGRLLTVVNEWLSFAQRQQAKSPSSAPLDLTGWRQAAPLLAPIRSITAATRQVGATGQQSAEFIAVGP